jgi:HAE1 family hydrophobic/amphiphilic exporter-1
MRLNISAWAIRRPIAPIVLFILLMVVGVVAFMGLGVNSNPNIDVPVVSVTVTQSGAAPEELETQVTRRVEDALASLDGVDHIRSDVTNGQSRTTVQFVIGVNADRATNDARDAISRIRPELPQSIDEPQVERVDVSGSEVLAYTVASPGMSDSELGWYVDNTIAKTLMSIRGVSEVERVGGSDREIRVNLDPARLIALGITVEDVNRQIREINANLPGGRSTLGTSEQSIRTLGSVETVDGLADMSIALPDHHNVRLKDLGTVVDGYAEPRRAAMLDGKAAVAFFVERSTGSSEVTVSDAVDAKIATIAAENPKILFHRTFSQADYAKSSYHGSMEALFLGAVLAIIVVLIFLRDWRATLIVGTALPLSIFPTFYPMQALGYTLNGISLLALTLVVGVLVDDAIVEIENIVRHMRMGKTAWQAAIDASDEIGLAVVATTMTIVAVFLPVSFMGGVAGQYFRQFGVTVAIAVLFSLLVARLITPMMAAHLAREHAESNHQPAILEKYLGLLGWALDHRWLTIGAAAVFFVGSMALVPLIPSDFIPASDDALTNLAVELPPGSTLEETLVAMRQITHIVGREAGVTSVYVSVGSGGDVRMAHAVIGLTPRGQRSRSQQQIEKDLTQKLKEVPGIRYNFGWDSGQDYSVVLTGEDPALLDTVADEAVREMRGIPMLSNIKTSASLLRPELQIRPLYDRASELGVSVASISDTARLATMGEINANLPKFNLPDRQIPIRVQIDPAATGDLQQIRNLRVPTASGGSVPLDAVADITIGSGTTEIKRYNRARQVSIGADLNGQPLGKADTLVKALPVMTHLPDGVRLQGSGDVEIMGQVFASFGLAMAAGILMVLAVLVLLFQNFLQPITIMGALPLSIGGAMIGLLLSGDSLSLPVLIGLLMLMGIVTKNAILFVDYVLLAIREQGLGRRMALMQAGAKRARPIIMTTIAMIAGMLPMALRLSDNAEFQAPMAVAVIGGLTTSTLLSLVMIPVGFTIIDDFQHWLGRVLGRFSVAHRAPAGAE